MRRRSHDKSLGPYLEHVHRFRVRFVEVDALGIVWHGHYLAYFELGREAFGEEYGIGYADIRAAGLVAPVVHASCDYLQPARHGQELAVFTRLHASASAKIEFSYEVRRADDDVLLASGRSTQVFTDEQGDLLLNQPRLMQAFYGQWLGQMVG